MKSLNLKKILKLILVMTSLQSLSKVPTYPNQPQEKTYSFYEEYFNDKSLGTEESIFRAKQWLTKAKREKNNLEVLKAYKVLMFKDKQENLLTYADSIIFYANLTHRKNVIGNAYLSKGIIYYNQKEVVRALENYILADKYISQTTDEYAMHKMKYVIAQSKYYLGFYDEALALLKECEVYFQTENDQAYLSTVHLLALCHTSLKNYVLAEEIIAIGIEDSNFTSLKNMTIYFQQAQAINNFHLKRYDAAIHQLNEIELYFKDHKDESNLMLTNFYTAKCYWMLGKKIKALPYLFKMDENLTKKNYIKPEFRETYEMLFEYYNETNELQLEIRYIKKLKALDNILTSKYKHLSRIIQKKYDTAQLIKIHKDALDRSNRRNWTGYIVSGLAIFTVLVLVYRNYINKKWYLEKFNKLVLTNINESKENRGTTNVDISDLNPELVQTILKKLERFEKDKIYLQENMNLTRLAKELQTNTKYTSRIILRFRGKKTVDYINELKVNHVIQMLKTQLKYRKYTTTALSDEGGFGSAQNFTRAFKNQTELTPMHFINLLNQSKEV